jgi:hypothetical protein
VSDSQTRKEFKPLSSLFLFLREVNGEKLSMFNMQVIIADQPKEYMREGNQFIMQVLIQAGYTNKALG